MQANTNDKQKAYKYRYEKVKLSDLKIHPLAKLIYLYLNIQALVQAIKDFGGMVSNIEVNSSFEVLSGWRRKLAAEFLGWDYVTVKVIEDIPTEDEENYIVHSNFYREKTYIEKYNEIKYYERTSEKRQGKRTDKTGEPSFDWRKTAAEKLDLKPTELYNLITVGDQPGDLLNTIDGVNNTLTSLANKVRAGVNTDKYVGIEEISLEPMTCPTCHCISTPRIVLEGEELFFEN